MSRSVSILLPAFNGMPFLPEAVDSIFRQSLTDWELVVVDDGSTDETADWLATREDPRVHVVSRPHQGLSAALNEGLSRCSGAFVARMDSDDVAHSTRLEEQVAFLEAHPEVGLVGTQIRMLGSRRAGFPSRLALDHDSIVRRLTQGRHGICHPSVMFRRDLVEDLGGYWGGDLGEEWDLYLRVSERAQLANLAKPLLDYRIHPGSLNAKRLADIREHIRYACESARRRRAGSDPIEFDAFRRTGSERSSVRRLLDATEGYALGQYRDALAGILGPHPVRGWMRLAWAALAAPRLTGHRIAHLLAGRPGRSEGVGQDA